MREYTNEEWKASIHERDRNLDTEGTITYPVGMTVQGTKRGSIIISTREVYQVMDENGVGEPFPVMRYICIDKDFIKQFMASIQIAAESILGPDFTVTEEDMKNMQFKVYRAKEESESDE